jgi:hypothetical protein
MNVECARHARPLGQSCEVSRLVYRCAREYGPCATDLLVEQLTGEQTSPVAIAMRDAASPVEDTVDRSLHTCFDDDRVDGRVASCAKPPVQESAHCSTRPRAGGERSHHFRSSLTSIVLRYFRS